MSADEGDIWIGIRRIISDLLDIPSGTILPLMDLAGDLGMKALDRAELALEIETDFGITVFTRPFAELRTVRDVVVYVEATLRNPLPRQESVA